MVDLLFFAGDPGAANIVRYLIIESEKLGLTSLVYADQDVCQFLSNRDIKAHSIEKTKISETILQNKPKSIICGTSVSPVSLGLDFIHEGQKNNILTVGVIDAMMSAPLRFSAGTSDPLFRLPDLLLVTNEESYSTWKKLGVKDQCIRHINHPQYQQVKDKAAKITKNERNTLRKKLFANYADKKVLVFVAEPEIPKENYSQRIGSIKGWETTPERTHLALQELLNEVERFGEEKPFSIILKLHPKNKKEDFSQYMEKIDLLIESGEPSDLIIAADAIVGVTSSLLIEAGFTGHPCLSIVTRTADLNELPAVVRNTITISSEPSSVGQWLSMLWTNKVTEQNNDQSTIDSFTLIRDFLREITETD